MAECLIPSLVLTLPPDVCIFGYENGNGNKRDKKSGGKG